MQKISFSINVSKWEAFEKLLTFHEHIFGSFNYFNAGQMFIIARDEHWIAVEIIGNLEATNALLQTVNTYQLNQPL
jgi:hypothetical protein